MFACGLAGRTAGLPTRLARLAKHRHTRPKGVPWFGYLQHSATYMYVLTNLRIRCYRFRLSTSRHPLYTFCLVEQDFDIFSPDDSFASLFDLTENSAIASVFLELAQGSYSHTQVEDIEPLEIGALFGNVGGFWGERMFGVSQIICSCVQHFGNACSGFKTEETRGGASC